MLVREKADNFFFFLVKHSEGFTHDKGLCKVKNKIKTEITMEVVGWIKGLTRKKQENHPKIVPY